MKVRFDEHTAAGAYARGWWVKTTLADALREAARQTPQRLAVVDDNRRLDCQSLFEQAAALAQALLARMPTGSVVSFMLPNWHEAVVIYLAATLAGMVVNPILPSLRDRELQFILSDAGSRMIFVPSSFGRHDYVSMLSRVLAELNTRPRLSCCAVIPAVTPPTDR
ncbi:AMP-binding enzyme family protein [Mycobacterium xenopi 4042]|uniref:AMP-binding enzyme family protein n=1 Tax=Mycobacterium xenopi 4042 TaxID=1299334 RepID=X8CK42_MYCXE|nr:AMP-binding enzyme family protein [Mycobacterium xenopi 4042]